MCGSVLEALLAGDGREGGAGAAGAPARRRGTLDAPVDEVGREDSPP